jgi:aldehyde:ferredoxin oxidoreductase
MSLTMNQGGWTGKVLKVDLTARTATALDTAANFGQYWGGTGIGYKAIFDAVQARNAVTAGSGRSLAWYSPDAPVTLGWGPLTGTGALCSGRTSITALSAQHVYSVPIAGHMGGHFSAQAKYAGWDAIIVTGQASGPVYIAVKDDDVQIVDAPELWHCGIFKVTEQITAAMGKGTQVAAIGQAGQNMVPQSCVQTGVSHSAGGVGAQLGAKNLLGIGVLGTGSVKIAASSGKWKSLLDYGLSIVGSDNHATVPNTLQAWAEYSPSSSGTRWWAYDGLYWGAADPPVNTGNCDPHDRQTIGYRCFKADNAYSQNFTVRMDGCHACPIRCHQAINVPSAAKWGPKTTAMNTCSGWWLASWGLPTKGNPTGAVSLAIAGSQVATQTSGAVIGAATIGGLSPTEVSLRSLENYVVGCSVQDDYGITNNYGLCTGGGPGTTSIPDILINGVGSNGTSYDVIGANNTVGTLGSHYLKPCVPAAEWTALTSSTGVLGLIAAGDVTATKEAGRLMAFKVGNFGTFLGGRSDEVIALLSNILSPLNDPATGAPFTSGSWAAGHTAGGDPQAPSYRSDLDLGSGGNYATYSWGQMVRCSSSVQYWNWGFPKHHSWENCNQVGALQNTNGNRDAQCHVTVMMNSSGLPNMLARQILDDQFAKYYTVDFPIAGTGLTAGGALTGMINSQDPGMSVGSNAKYNQANIPAATPVNWQKARGARFAMARKELTDSLNLCGWVYPWFYSPLKERDYQGDISLESQYFNAVTGNNLTTLQLDHEGERFHTLQNALTAYLWGYNTSGFGTNTFAIPGAWANKSLPAEGALNYAAGSSPSAPGMQAVSANPVAYGTTFGSAAFCPFSTALNTAGTAALAPVSFIARPMNTTTYSWRVQHDMPCPAWGIAAATGIGGKGTVAFTVGGGYYGTYPDWAQGLQLLYQVFNYDYLDGTHTTNSGLPTTSSYALLGMNASGTINVQQFMSDAGLLPW